MEATTTAPPTEIGAEKATLGSALFEAEAAAKAKAAAEAEE